MMAIIKKKQLRELSVEEIKKRLVELRLELSKDRAQIAVGGTPANPGRTREVCKTIARLLTELKKRQGRL